MKKTFIYIVDSVLLVGTLALFIAAFQYARPLIGSPEDGFTTTGAVLFSFDRADTLFIDDTPAFSSPQRISVRDSARITLEPGIYYWKVEGDLPSDVRQINVTSFVELRVRAEGEGYAVTNAGSTKLHVDLYEEGILIDSMELVPDQTEEAQGDQFVGEYHA